MSFTATGQPTANIFEQGMSGQENDKFAGLLARYNFAAPPSLSVDSVDVPNSSAPIFDKAVEALGDGVGGAINVAGNAFGATVDAAADVGMVAATTTIAAMALLGDIISEQRENLAREEQIAIDGDGDGVPGVVPLSPEMQAALGSARDDGVMEKLHRAFEGYADVMCAQAGIDQNDIGLNGDPALALQAAREAMLVGRSGAEMSA